jgi:Methyltransferase domain
MDDFEGRIAQLDTTLFGLVHTQSTEKDRRSWLALQRAVRDVKARYVYLEIGSYRGGSLQQYLQDPKCSRIYSIDNRTVDDRHSENSTQAMLDNLSAVAPDEMHRLVCFDTDAHDVPRGSIRDAVDICFIDGKHTNEAVLSDFAFCLGVCASDAVIYFHDAGCTRAGIAACLRRLKRSSRPFVAYKLPGDTFVVALLDSPVYADARVRSAAVAVHGERWLKTSAISGRVRRWVPSGLRPACVRARDCLWGAAPRSR